VCRDDVARAFKYWGKNIVGKLRGAFEEKKWVL